MISVVIPAYNCADTIIRCLQSLKVQTYDDYEVIVVDDGSTDNTLSVVKEFEFDKLRVFSKENGGPSSARNFGISQCSSDSEYVFFVDSDDTIDACYLETMILHTTSGYLTVCGVNHVVKGELRYGRVSGKISKLDEIWSNSDYFNLLQTGLINPLWNKCYSLYVIRENLLEIPENLPEDIQFNLKYLRFCKGIIHIDQPLYNYIHRPDSVTSKPVESLYSEYLKIQENLEAIVSPANLTDVREFVYPQYLATTLVYLRRNVYDVPKKYLSNSDIKRAIASHRPQSIGDKVIKYLFLFKLLRLLKIYTSR